MRGTFAANANWPDARRNTPADAGNFRCTVEISPSTWKHPRRCGELSERRLYFCTPHGNTPADAGNLDGLDLLCTSRKKHPRRCGELARESTAWRPTQETPPQMRGTLRYHASVSFDFGNTPADAGNFRVRRCRSRSRRKHPRRCGELSGATTIVTSFLETPPQMRGTFCSRIMRTLTPGNTPADAGNFQNDTRSVLRRPKHPRRCGELSNISNFNPIKSLYLEVFAYSRV